MSKYYIKNDDNGKFLYIDEDETHIEEVDRSSFASDYESFRVANTIRKIILDRFPMANVVCS
jgi:hypothetical protein